MNRVTFLAFFLLLSLPFTYGQTDSAIKAGQIIRLEQRLADALPGDSATWNKYLDPTWHLVDEDGNGSFRAEFLAGFKPWPAAISGHVSVTRPVLGFHGDVAVIQYVADEYETYYGQKLHTTYGTMDVWYKTDTSWMMLSMQDFEIPGFPPSVKVDPAVAKSYTGTYLLSDENLAVVSYKADTLYIQKNNRKAEALYPESKNVFFRRTDARGRKIFITDDTGTKLLLERRNGQDVTWKKIKS